MATTIQLPALRKELTEAGFTVLRSGQYRDEDPLATHVYRDHVTGGAEVVVGSTEGRRQALAFLRGRHSARRDPLGLGIRVS
ncbi:MAG: hypothetical protein QJR09_05130 [Micrococcus sp.]|nr:hypothetical protein [Micrococcus sp.]